jgi:cysteinyl-tRNA synthetase
MATLFELSHKVNSLLNSGEPVSEGTLSAIDRLYRELGGDVLGLVPDDLTEDLGGELVDELVRLLIEVRQEARQARDWASADRIRDRLAEVGVLLEDGPEGTRWRISL